VTSIGHNIAGASIGLACYSWIDRPILTFTSAVIAGFVSHYVFDFIPHGHYKDVGTRESDGSLIEIDKKTLIFVLLDAIPSLIAINLAVFFMSDSLWTAFIVASAIAAAQLPDVTEFLIDIGLIKKVSFWQNIGISTCSSQYIGIAHLLLLAGYGHGRTFGS